MDFVKTIVLDRQMVRIVGVNLLVGCFVVFCLLWAVQYGEWTGWAFLYNRILLWERILGRVQ